MVLLYGTDNTSIMSTSNNISFISLTWIITLNTNDAWFPCITRCLGNITVLVTPGAKTKHLLVEKLKG